MPAFVQKVAEDSTVDKRLKTVYLKVLDYTNTDYSAIEAIEWAIRDNNTTKLPKEGRQGGMGLQTLCRFFKENKGCIRIVSDAGYWRTEKNGKIRKENLSSPFPGTVIDFEINTTEDQSDLFCYDDTLKRVLKGGS